MTSLDTELAEGSESPYSTLEVQHVLLATVELLADAEVELLSLLAVSVALDNSELRRLADKVLGPGVVPSTVFKSITELPLVERVHGRYRVVAPLDTVLAERYLREAPARFADAHAELTAIEQDREAVLTSSGASPDEVWQSKALTAYYLLRLAPDRASSEFIDAFDGAPLRNRTSARLWLGSLARRFASISHEQPRIAVFFAAFRLYVAGAYDEAVDSLTELIEDRDDDQVAAISMHLIAVQLPRPSRRRVELLERSVALSRMLGLAENLIMSLNTLVYQHLSSRDPADAKVARTLAEENDQTADALGVAVFQAATRLARARTLLAHARAQYRDEWRAHEEVLSLLEDAQRFARQANEISAWLRPNFVKIQLLAGAGYLQEALEVLAASVEEVEGAAAIGELPMAEFERMLDRLETHLSEGSHEAAILEDLERRLRSEARRSRR